MKEKMIMAWFMFVIIITTFSLVFWFYWALFQNSFWHYIALGVGYIIMASVILVPLIIALRYTVIYFTTKDKEESVDKNVEEV